jgi:hypothetical protein
MPLFLLIIGIVFLVASVRGEHKLFFETLKGDFTGPNNFIYWGLSIWVIIIVGYVKALKPLSDAFLVLVILMLFLANRGFFDRFMEILSGTEIKEGVADNPLNFAAASIANIRKIMN